MNNIDDEKYRADGFGSLSAQDRIQMEKDLRALEADGTIEFVDGMWRIAPPKNAD